MQVSVTIQHRSLRLLPSHPQAHSHLVLPWTRAEPARNSKREGDEADEDDVAERHRDDRNWVFEGWRKV